jgi:hypothetical protein
MKTGVNVTSEADYPLRDEFGVCRFVPSGQYAGVRVSDSTCNRWVEWFFRTSVSTYA